LIECSFGLVRRLHPPAAMETESPQKILVATDFSAASDEALGRAIDTAKSSTAEVEIIHVIEPAEEYPFGLFYLDSDSGALYTHVENELSRRADRFRQAGLRCETKIVEGNASMEIAKRGREIDADLIVVGTHGRTGLAHAMLGSVAERVVRRASCPVLTVPCCRKAAQAMDATTGRTI
jgi:nucleotide-binding universal stress UspA family protein